MARRQASVGDRELELLTWIAERGGATVAQAVAGYGSDHGLARSTVLTMMERLREKKHLTRRRVDGVYRYTSPAPPGEVLRGVVERFVEGPLGGSLSPFTTYLAQAETVDEEELEELEALVARLRGGEGDPR